LNHISATKCRSVYYTRGEFPALQGKDVHQWTQTAYGTWDIDIAESLSTFSDINHAIRLFHWLDTQRLDACLARDLPGLAREMAMLRSIVVESDEHASVQAVKYEYDATEMTAEIEVEQEEALEYTDDMCFVYDEWDHTRQGFREIWCRMVESSDKPLAGWYVTQTLEKHRGLLKQLAKCCCAVDDRHE
jgi:hypothetical protein